MQKKYLSHALKSGQIAAGKAFNLSQLSAKFQVWASENHKLTDIEGLACWFADQPEKGLEYFQNLQEIEGFSQSGFEKIKGVEIPDLSDVGNEPPMFTSITM